MVGDLISCCCTRVTSRQRVCIEPRRDERSDRIPASTAPSAGRLFTAASAAVQCLSTVSTSDRVRSLYDLEQEVIPAHAVHHSPSLISWRRMERLRTRSRKAWLLHSAWQRVCSVPWDAGRQYTQVDYNSIQAAQAHQGFTAARCARRCSQYSR